MNAALNTITSTICCYSATIIIGIIIIISLITVLYISTPHSATTPTPSRL